MRSADKRFLDLIKSTSASVNTSPTQIVSLKIKSLSPLVFTYNEKLIIDNKFYTLDKNFSTTDLKDDNGNYYDLQIGDRVQAFSMNNDQSYYVLANKSGGRWWSEEVLQIIQN